MNPMEEYFSIEREDVEKTAQSRQIRAMLHHALGSGVRVNKTLSIDPNSLPSGLRGMLNTAGVTNSSSLGDVLRALHTTAQNAAIPGFNVDDAHDALRLLRARAPQAFSVRAPRPPVGPPRNPFGFTEQAYAIERISRAAREGRLSDDMKKFWIKHVGDLRKGPNPTWSRSEFDTLFGSHLAPPPAPPIMRVRGHVPLKEQFKAIRMVDKSTHIPDDMKSSLKNQLLSEAREGRAESFKLLKKEIAPSVGSRIWSGVKGVGSGVKGLAQRGLSYPGAERDRLLSQARTVTQKTKALADLAEQAADPITKQRAQDQLDVLRQAYKGRFESEALRSMARDPERAIEFTAAVKDLERGFTSPSTGLAQIPEKLRGLISPNAGSSLPKSKGPSMPLGLSSEEMVRRSGIQGSADSLAKVLGPAALTGGAVASGFRFADPRPMGAYTMNVPGVGRYDYDPKR